VNSFACDDVLENEIKMVAKAEYSDSDFITDVNIDSLEIFDLGGYEAEYIEYFIINLEYTDEYEDLYLDSNKRELDQDMYFEIEYSRDDCNIHSTRTTLDKETYKKWVKKSTNLELENME
jgi:hypothetical protein